MQKAKDAKILAKPKKQGQRSALNTRTQTRSSVVSGCAAATIFYANAFSTARHICKKKILCPSSGLILMCRYSPPPVLPFPSLRLTLFLSIFNAFCTANHLDFAFLVIFSHFCIFSFLHPVFRPEGGGDAVKSARNSTHLHTFLHSPKDH